MASPKRKHKTLITKELPAFKVAIEDMEFSDWWDEKHAAKLDMEKHVCLSGWPTRLASP